MNESSSKETTLACKVSNPLQKTDIHYVQAAVMHIYILLQIFEDFG